MATERVYFDFKEIYWEISLNFAEKLQYMSIMRYISFIIIAVCLMSCNGHSEHWNTLSQVESFIEERPDSALFTLEQVNASELSGKEEKAKYALLYSMALDKNFVDKTDFEILQSAIDYYDAHGTSTDKLRTFYYQGRIYQNMGNDASAMTCYLNALDKGQDSDDILTKARLLVVQGNIYTSLMKWEKATEVNMLAAEYFKEADKTESYANCLLKASQSSMQQGDIDTAKKCLDLCRNISDKISNRLLGKLYSGYLAYYIQIDSVSEIKPTIEEYRSKVAPVNMDYISVADAYVYLGEYVRALDAILRMQDFKNAEQETRYYAVLTGIYEQTNDYKNALDNYMKFNKLYADKVSTIFKQDTQFMEERYNLELQAIKERDAKNRILFLGIVFIVALTSVIIYIRGRLKIRSMKQSIAEQEAERYKLLYEQMEYERDNLSDLLSHNNDLDNDAKRAVAQRLELLNKFFTVYITNNSEISRKVDKELDELLANKDAFMASTRLAFAGSHPDFIKYLEEHNLSEREIEYCCLYALGLKGKEVGSYIKMRSHYNISSTVREKLGLAESDTNLGIHIRKLLASL